jgi:hypothetical protein
MFQIPASILGGRDNPIPSQFPYASNGSKILDVKVGAVRVKLEFPGFLPVEFFFAKLSM